MLMLEREVGQRILIGDDVSLELLGIVFTDRRGRIEVRLAVGDETLVLEWSIGQRATLEWLGVEIVLGRITRRQNGQHAASFGFEAPVDVRIWREEVHERIQANGGVPRKSICPGGEPSGAASGQTQ